jgi:hypothetical protein
LVTGWLVLTGCGESSGPDASPGGTGGSVTAASSTPASTAPSSTTAAPPDRSAAAEKLRQQVIEGWSAVSTVGGSLSMKAGPVHSRGTFSATMDDGRRTALQLDLKVTSVGSTAPMKLLAVDDRSFIGGEKVLTQLQATPSTAEWLELTGSTRKVVKQAARKLDRSFEFTAADRPLLIADAAVEVTPAGTDTIRGTSVRRFEVDVDVKTLLAASGGDAYTWADKVGGSTQSVTVWLDEDQRVVRLAEKYDVTYWVAEVTIDWQDFDEPVELSAPHPDAVAER